LTINELPVTAHRGIPIQPQGTIGQQEKKGLVALTFSQGYNRLLNGQSIQSISSSCLLRDPGGVCCVLGGSTKKGDERCQEPYSL